MTSASAPTIGVEGTRGGTGLAWGTGGETNLMVRPIETLWAELEANAHRPEVQRQIRDAIRQGTIRVAPVGGDRIKIIPTGRPDPNSRVRSHVEGPAPPRAPAPSPSTAQDARPALSP
jgi:hypothetical protein